MSEETNSWKAMKVDRILHPEPGSLVVVTSGKYLAPTGSRLVRYENGYSELVNEKEFILRFKKVS